MKKITARQYAGALYEALIDSSGEQLKTRLRNFLLMLKAKREWKNLAKVLRAFDKIYEERSGQLSAEIISSRPLKDSELKNIEAKINLSDKKWSSVTNMVEPEILGGLIVKQSDKLWDMSISGQLKRLKEKIY